MIAPKEIYLIPINKNKNMQPQRKQVRVYFKDAPCIMYLCRVWPNIREHVICHNNMFEMLCYVMHPGFNTNNIRLMRASFINRNMSLKK